MIYLFLAQGFEEMEMTAPLDVLRRAGAEIKTVSVTDKKEVSGAHGITVIADITADEVDFDALSGVILPGGIPGTPNLKKSETVKKALECANEKGALIAAICAAPSILGFYGYLNGRCATCFPGFENELTSAQVLRQPAVCDGNIITGQGAGAAYDFAFELVTYLKGKNAADDLKKGMLYR